MVKAFSCAACGFRVKSRLKRDGTVGIDARCQRVSSVDIVDEQFDIPLHRYREIRSVMYRRQRHSRASRNGKWYSVMPAS